MTIPELFGPNVAIARIILSNRVNEGEYEIAKATVAFRLTVPLYPEQRLCKAPTAERILELFGGLRRHRLLQGGKEVDRFQDKLPTSGTEVLDLLGVNREAFSE